MLMNVKGTHNFELNNIGEPFGQTNSTNKGKLW